MHEVAEDAHVELQVRSGVTGEGPRKAYQQMGLQTRRKRAKGAVYERASDGYELMYTDKMVVRSNWIPNCKVERYDDSTLPDGVLHEMAQLVRRHRRGSGEGDDGNIEQIAQHLTDCTGDAMAYVVVWHGVESSSTGDTSGVASHVSGDASEVRRKDGRCTRPVKVRQRRMRQPATSMLSEKVWREMRKCIAGRDQHDGVT